MARTKNTEHKVGLMLNPFKKVNLHGVELLDVGKVRQVCEKKGKNAWFRIRVRI